MADVKKENAAFNVTKDLRDVSNNLSNRITVLEQKNHEMEQLAVKQQYELDAHLEDFDKEIAILQKDAAEISASIDNIQKRLMQIVMTIRRTGKTETFGRLQRNLEDFKPEQWITREELVRIVQRKM